MSKIDNWQLFSFTVTFGEPPPQPGEWMIEGLRYRDKWESKLLRTADWSPLKQADYLELGSGLCRPRHQTEPIHRPRLTPSGQRSIMPHTHSPGQAPKPSGP